MILMRYKFMKNIKEEIERLEELTQKSSAGPKNKIHDPEEYKVERLPETDKAYKIVTNPDWAASEAYAPWINKKFYDNVWLCYKEGDKKKSKVQNKKEKTALNVANCFVCSCSTFYFENICKHTAIVKLKTKNKDKLEPKEKRWLNIT
jgi:hypothetical protein